PERDTGGPGSPLHAAASDTAAAAAARRPRLRTPRSLGPRPHPTPHDRSGDATAPRSRRTGAPGPGVQLAVSATSRLRVAFGSTGMPGPIVVAKVTFLRYFPLAAEGLARCTS